MDAHGKLCLYIGDVSLTFNKMDGEFKCPVITKKMRDDERVMEDVLCDALFGGISSLIKPRAKRSKKGADAGEAEGDKKEARGGHASSSAGAAGGAGAAP